MIDILNPVHYVTANNPEGVNGVLHKYGLAVEDEADIFDAVDMLTEEHGKKAVNEIMKHHPDKDALRYSKTIGSINDFPHIELDTQEVPINGIRTPANGNGNGNGNMQDRWILIALLLLAIFAVGTWVGKQTK